MIVVCAYSSLRKETRAALETYAAGRELIFRDVNGTQTGYHEFLDEMWQAGVGFAVVEHDIVIDSTTLDDFDACPELWCQRTYELAVGFVGLPDGPASALGCVRFRAALLEAEPDAIEAAGYSDNTGVPENAWWRIDARLNLVLHERGYRPHTHLPPVVHLNPKQKLARA